MWDKKREADYLFLCVSIESLKILKQKPTLSEYLRPMNVEPLRIFFFCLHVFPLIYTIQAFDPRRKKNWTITHTMWMERYFTYSFSYSTQHRLLRERQTTMEVLQYIPMSEDVEGASTHQRGARLPITPGSAASQSSPSLQHPAGPVDQTWLVHHECPPGPLPDTLTGPPSSALPEVMTNC